MGDDGQNVPYCFTNVNSLENKLHTTNRRLSERRKKLPGFSQLEPQNRHFPRGEDRLLHRNALGQIPWFIHIATEFRSDMIGK